MKFGLLIDFDLLKAAISTNAKPEIVLLRFGRQDGVRGRSMLFPVSHLLISLPSEGQSLLANQILSTYLKWKLIYFYGNPKLLGKGSIFLQNQECVNILECSVTFCEYKKMYF